MGSTSQLVTWKMPRASGLNGCRRTAWIQARAIRAAPNSVKVISSRKRRISPNIWDSLPKGNCLLSHGHVAMRAGGGTPTKRFAAYHSRQKAKTAWPKPGGLRIPLVNGYRPYYGRPPVGNGHDAAGFSAVFAPGAAAVDGGVAG